MTSPLLRLNQSEWENLCDGCGRCCLVKLQEEGSEKVHYTNLACRFLDCSTCRCTVYPERGEKQPECIVLTKENLEVLQWMPTTCAYRRFDEGRAPIEDHESIRVNDMIISEDLVDEDMLEEHVISWITTDPI